MNTFLTDLMKKGHTQDEMFAVIFESEGKRRRRRLQAIVIEEVAAHNLKKMNELLTYQELGIWRRDNGFDRIAADENLWASRQLPLTPEQLAQNLWSEVTEQLTQNLWSEVNALRDAISMPARAPLQETTEFVDGLEGKFPEVEFAVIKRYVERRSREAARAQVTAVTRVDTVQYCIPISQTPEPPSGVYLNLENNEGEMDPGLKEEPKSSSAGSGLETPDSNVPRTRGCGNNDEPPLTAS